MGYRKHSGVEVEGIVVGRTSESGGHIRYPVKATITVHCADGRSRKGPAEYTIDEDPFGEMKADIVAWKIRSNRSRGVCQEIT
jgi:hypothetical protein